MTVLTDTLRDRRREIWLIAALVILGLTVWAFAELADEVLDGDTARFDETILYAMREADDPTDPLGPAWFEEMMRDVTALGSMVFIIGITALVIGFLVLSGQYGGAVLVFVAVAGGTVISQGLKDLFVRSRPDIVAHGMETFTASFPSGHATLSAVTYLTLGALLMRLRARKTEKAYIMFVAVLLAVSVGLSRLYLGVHWPTDVVAGWTIGAGWALVCWFVAAWLQARGTVEEEIEGAEAGPASRRKAARRTLDAY